jgi:uncharacterized sulfatase
MHESLAQSIDLAPTLLKAAGITPPAKMPGINLLDEAAVTARTTIYGECFTHNYVNMTQPAQSSLKWRWIIDGHEKLILPNVINQPQDVPELYDLRTDPTEEKNLAKDRADAVMRLAEKIDAWWTP